jgi:DASS family divalent anion:Na+ symporter
MMASFLNKLGLTGWFTNMVVGKIQGLHWMLGFVVVIFIYFYTHYFFASNVAHIGAMYPAFLVLCVALGTPPALAALVLGFSSNLFGILTHYGSGPAPIFFEAGYVKIGEWWKLGFIFSLVHLITWILIGGCWWKVLGLW